MWKFFIYILSIALLCVATPTYAYFNSLEVVRFHGFDEEGRFVEVPAYVGASSGYLFGILPAVIITEPSRIGNYDQASDRLGVSILSGFSKTCSVFSGSFPYLLKKGFWDFPIWITVGCEKKRQYHEYKPTPLPEVKVDPRLKQEEKRTTLNLQEKNSKPPTIVEVPEEDRKEISTPVPVLSLKTKTKSSTEELPITVKNIVPSENSHDTQKIILPPIPSSIPDATSNSHSGYTVDSERGEDNAHKWESSGLPNWVKKRVSE